MLFYSQSEYRAVRGASGASKKLNYLFFIFRKAKYKKAASGGEAAFCFSERKGGSSEK